jgi:hypothetical protein
MPQITNALHEKAAYGRLVQNSITLVLADIFQKIIGSSVSACCHAILLLVLSKEYTM